MLGLAAVAAGWASYRASQADGDMITNFNEGIRTVDEASLAYTDANQNLVQGQALFLDFVKAVQADDDELIEYILTTLMSEDLQAAVIWWQEQEDHATPFVEENPDYNPEAFQRGQALDAQAQAFFDQARVANERGDRFSLITSGSWSSRDPPPPARRRAVSAGGRAGTRRPGRLGRVLLLAAAGAAGERILDRRVRPAVGALVVRGDHGVAAIVLEHPTGAVPPVRAGHLANPGAPQPGVVVHDCLLVPPAAGGPDDGSTRNHQTIEPPGRVPYSRDSRSPSHRDRHERDGA